MNIAKVRKLFEKLYPFLIVLFIGYAIADLIILNYRDKVLPTQAPPAKPQKPPISELVPRSSYSIITGRNIFNPEGTIPDVLRGTDQKEGIDQEADNTPTPSTLPLTLVGTIVHGNPKKSIATIEVKPKNQVIAYRVDHDIENLATITEVQRKRVILRNASSGRLEYIEMKLGADKISFSGAKPMLDQVKDVAQVAENKFEIKRSDLNKYISDLAGTLQQAAMVPRRGANGEIECYKFISIQPDSVFTRLDFQAGDCLKQVNGESIDNPSKAMELFNQLKNSNNIQLKVERDGRDQTKDYTVK